MANATEIRWAPTPPAQTPGTLVDANSIAYVLPCRHCERMLTVTPIVYREFDSVTCPECAGRNGKGGGR